MDEIKTGKERLDFLIEAQQDTALLQVVDYLKGLDEDDIFLNQEKNLQGMCEYVKGRAKELAVNGVSFVEDSIVYEWALTYWSQSNEALGIKIEAPKPTQKGATVTNVSTAAIPKAQLSLF